MTNCIKCLAPLPPIKLREGRPLQERKFQTKDFFGFAEEYLEITADGKLRAVGPAEGFDPHPSNYTGKLGFFSSFQDIQVGTERGDDPGYIVFEAEFVDGQLRGPIELWMLERGDY